MASLYVIIGDITSEQNDPITTRKAYENGLRMFELHDKKIPLNKELQRYLGRLYFSLGLMDNDKTKLRNAYNTLKALKAGGHALPTDEQTLDQLTELLQID